MNSEGYIAAAIGYNYAMLLTLNSMIALSLISLQSPAVAAPTPIRGPATAITQAATGDEGPMDAVPPTSKCSKDRRLARTLRYAMLPLSGPVGDSTMTDALAEFLNRTSATTGVNALVVEFNLAGGDHDATIALAEQLVQVRKRMPVIGVLGSCTGIGAILPMVCDYLVVLNPTADTPALEWFPASDTPTAEISVEVGQCFEAIVSRAADRAYMKSVVTALLDPTADLYLWRGADGCPEASQSAPSGVSAIQLSSGKDALAGMTASQLVESGLALSVSGSIDSVGKALGVEKWIAQPEVAGKILSQIRERRARDLSQQNLALKTGFTAVKNARALVGGLIEAEANARAADPRKQQYRQTYSRNWNSQSANSSQSSSWEFTRVGTSAWRKNCDVAIVAWESAVRLYEEASAATNQAKVIASTLAQSPAMLRDSEFKAEVLALQSEVDALMSQAPVLTVKGDAAKQALAFLRANYNNPAM